MKYFFLAVTTLASCTAYSKVTPTTIIGEAANVSYLGCLSSTTGITKTESLNLIVKNNNDNEYRKLMSDQLNVGYDFHRNYPDIDCSQILISTIDSLYIKLQKSLPK